VREKKTFAQCAPSRSRAPCVVTAANPPPPGSGPLSGWITTQRPSRICNVGGRKKIPRGLYHGVCSGPVNTDGACMSIVPSVSPWYDPSSARTRTWGKKSAASDAFSGLGMNPFLTKYVRIAIFTATSIAVEPLSL
jgi:hypothetical protein